MHYNRRVLLLGIGASCIALAWMWLAQSRIDPAPPVPVTVPDKKSEVLVANRALNVGQALGDDMVEWVVTPEKDIKPGAIWRSQGSGIVNPYSGRILIQAVAKSMPLMPQDFVDATGRNYIAAQIQPGKRAYAITIDAKGTATAGNFILPDDHVDIIHSFNSNMGLQSETLISNIRVLAVGQTIHGDGLSTAGDTATVEVDLREAEMLATAQRTGQISLALRNPAESQSVPVQPSNLTIIRPTSAAEKAP